MQDFSEKIWKIREKRCTFVILHTIMEKGKENIERLLRRFCEAKDGLRIRRLYATMRTVDLAREMGLTAKQIENYVYRHNTERWARKKPFIRSQINRENARKRWKKWKNIRLKCEYFLSSGTFPVLCRQNLPQRRETSKSAETGSPPQAENFKISWNRLAPSGGNPNWVHPIGEPSAPD